MSSPRCLIQLQARNTLLIPASLKQVMVMGPYLQLMVQCGLSYLNTEYTVTSLLFFWKGGERDLWRSEVFLACSLSQFWMLDPFSKAETQHLARLIGQRFLGSACLCCPPLGSQRLATMPGSFHGFQDLSSHSRVLIASRLPTELSSRPSSCLCSVVRSHSE